MIKIDKVVKVVGDAASVAMGLAMIAVSYASAKAVFTPAPKKSFFKFGK